MKPTTDFKFKDENEDLLKASNAENKALKNTIEKQGLIIRDKDDIIKAKDVVIKNLKSVIEYKENEAQGVNRQIKENIMVLKQNDNIMRKFANTKDKRHVKEPTEPVFKEIVKEFSLNYGKLVVSNTSKEILNLVKKDGF